MVGRSAGFSRDDTVETQLTKVEFIDENIDHPHRVGVRHIVIQTLGKQRALASMLSLDKTLHWRPPLISNPSSHSKVDANVFTQPGPISAGDYHLLRVDFGHLRLAGNSPGCVITPVSPRVAEGTSAGATNEAIHRRGEPDTS
ncbi:hypothetical protein SAMN05216591_3307 [Pseudomonas extremaustralis]|uniref:Uncharacterized protein n=1 Tax=Pseudomonas extremaustralis TaxID=359110 RepID=A0ABY0NJG2_9PSED|nr:hypothetical protein SAMN05216591_3307 [Pseudomonas extremaustralis]